MKSLTATLNKLTAQERSEALYDLHGVRDDQINETSDFLKNKLQELSRCLLSILSNLPPTQTEAYRLAVETNPTYVDNLKLRFLRADEYDCIKASKRMILHFTYKMNLFCGNSNNSKANPHQLLTRDIRFSDLTPEEQNILKDDAIVQFLPCRDRAGRTTIMFNGSANELYNTNGGDTDAMFRALFWFTTAITSDIETQRKGIVVIYWSVGQTRVVPRQRMKQMETWHNASPMRHVSHHICMDKNEGLFGVVMNAFLSIAESRSMARLRFHTGTSLECVYKLMTFGISKDTIPITDMGYVDTANNRKMLDVLSSREEMVAASSSQLPTSTTAASNSSSSQIMVRQANNSDDQDDKQDNDNKGIILIPNNMDVILGTRGCQPTKRPGLLRMHLIISNYQERYENMARHTKIEIAKLVLKEMRDTGSRFLTDAPYNLGGYVECLEKVSLEKISHGFRNLRMKSKSKDGSKGKDKGGSSSKTKPKPKNGSKKRSLENATEK